MRFNGGILMLMKERLRRLLEPAQTSPSDSFSWNDKRPVRKQIASGFRIAVGLNAGFVVIGAVSGGLVRLSAAHPKDAFIAWVTVVVGAVIMLWTANRWAPMVTAFFFGPAVVKIVAALVFEQDTYYSSYSTTRLEAAEFLPYALAVVFLTLRFVDKRPPQTTILDRLALTFFAFTSLKELVSPHRFPHWPLLLGLLALFAAWCAHRAGAKRRRRHRVHADAGISPIAP